MAHGAGRKMKDIKKEKIGLIAGSGRYTLYLFRELAGKGMEVVVLAIKKKIDENLVREAGKLYYIDFGQLGKLIEILKEENINKVVVAGRLNHNYLYRRIRLDKTAIKLLLRLKDKRANSILNGFGEELKKEGIELVDSFRYVSDSAIEPGVLTACKPTKEELRDMEFGYRMAKNIAGLDIGQTVIVKDMAVIAVEAMEGTDETIKRAGGISGQGNVMVKVSKPCQDKRFDLPVLGTKTVKLAIANGVRVIAFSSEYTVLLDKEKMIEECNANGIVLFAVGETNTNS
jgi:hypothetical protein